MNGADSGVINDVHVNSILVRFSAEMFLLSQEVLSRFLKLGFGSKVKVLKKLLLPYKNLNINLNYGYQDASEMF